MRTHQKRRLKNVLRIVVFAVLFLLVVLYFYNAKPKVKNEKTEEKQVATEPEIRNGDIIFQISSSEQSKIMLSATHSEYSNCGIIYKSGDDFYVFEVEQTVKPAPLVKWTEQGKDSSYVIKRLKNADKILTPETLQEMRKVGLTFRGKNHDPAFDWSDDKIYPAEMIWKIYQRTTGVELCKPQKLSDLDLANEIVKKQLAERYGDKIPMNEIVISPKDLFESELLTNVKSN